MNIYKYVKISYQFGPLDINTKFTSSILFTLELPTNQYLDLEYICYVQVEMLYKLQLVQEFCTSCNLYKQLVQVATCTNFGPVQVTTCTSSKFYHL